MEIVADLERPSFRLSFASYSIHRRFVLRLWHHRRSPKFLLLISCCAFFGKIATAQRLRITHETRTFPRPVRRRSLGRLKILRAKSLNDSLQPHESSALAESLGFLRSMVPRLSKCISRRLRGVRKLRNLSENADSGKSAACDPALDRSLLHARISRCDIARASSAIVRSSCRGGNEPILSGHTLDAHTCAPRRVRDFSGKYNIRVREARGEQRPRRRP